MNTGRAEQRIIGGMFGLEPGVGRIGTEPNFLGGSCLFLATARSALALLGRSIRPRQAWLPSYLCGVVIDAFAAERSKIRFYPVDEQLRFVDQDWLRGIERGDLVLFIDYFGFAQWHEAGAAARERGAWVVEDASHALLNEHFCESSHYVIFSPRKSLGVPDGGVLQARAGSKLPDCDLGPPPAQWWQEALTASRLRAEFDRHGGKQDWLGLFQKTEAAAPLEPAAMSNLSESLLRSKIDFSEIASRRRENYQYLASALREYAMLPTLPAGVVPLGFPVRLQDRDRVRLALFGAGIYPPVHWPIAGLVPAEFSASHRLAGQIMTLPCDQRYSRESMSRMVDCLLAARPTPAFVQS